MFLTSFARSYSRLSPSTIYSKAIILAQPAKNSSVSHVRLLNTVVKPNILNKPRLLNWTPVRKVGSDHGKIWFAERILAVTLLGVIPTAFLMPCKSMDAVMAVSVMMHLHWGLEAIVVDYVRAVIFGPVIPKVALVGLYVLTIGTLGGLFLLIKNDIGLAESIKRFWAIKGATKK